MRPWQKVMVDLATCLKFPAFMNEDGSASEFNSYTLDGVVVRVYAAGISSMDRR